MNNDNRNELVVSIDNVGFFWTASNYEGFGMLVVGSMLSGLIPIINNITVLRQFVDRKAYGLVIDFDYESENVAKDIMDDLLSLDIETLMCEPIKTAAEYAWDRKIKESEKGLLDINEHENG